MVVQARSRGICSSCDLPIKRGALVANLDGEWVHVHHLPHERPDTWPTPKRIVRTGTTAQQLDDLMDDLRDEFLDPDDLDSLLDVTSVELCVKVRNPHAEHPDPHVTGLFVAFSAGQLVDGDELEERRWDLWADAVDLLRELFLDEYDHSYTEGGEGGVVWP